MRIGFDRAMGSIVGVVATCFVALLAGCGGGGSTELSALQPESPTNSDVLAVSDQPEFKVVSLTKVSETRVSRTIFEYVFRITVSNSGAPQVSVEAIVASVGEGTTIVDGVVVVGDVPTGSVVNPADTITLRHDRSVPFNESAIQWRFRSIPENPAILAGASLFNLPSASAVIDSKFRSRLSVKARDSRNLIIALEVSNGTEGGGLPTIDIDGVLSWTPTPADFLTSSLRLVVKLKHGEPEEFLLPVRVTRERLVENIVLNGQGKYSDADGRYLFLIEPSEPGGSVGGTLSLKEYYDKNNAFTHRALPSDQNLIVTNLRSPASFPITFDSVSASSQDLASNRARALASRRETKSTALASDCNQPEMAWCHPFRGQKVYKDVAFDPRDGDWKTHDYTIYTTRKDIPEWGPGSIRAEPYVVAQVESNCEFESDCSEFEGTPVILIHGFTAEFANDGKGIFKVGGGEGTWGSLASALVRRGYKGNPVYELRWMTQMRFEEAAGLLVSVARHVSAKTGRKPFVIAHSFGGIAAHLAIAGEGVVWDASSKKWVKQSAGTKDRSLFDGLITLGSPLSGINDTAAGRFVYGRDVQDWTINLCLSVTCVQAGATDVGLFVTVEQLAAAIDPVGLLAYGESIDRIRGAWRANRVALGVGRVHAVVSLRSRPSDYLTLMSGAASWLLGDGLISMAGQAIVHEDFIATGEVIGSPVTYNFPEKLDKYLAPDFFGAINRPPARDSRDSLLHLSMNGRNYHFASRAGHSGTQVGVLGTASGLALPYVFQHPRYKIAYYEKEVVVGENIFGVNIYASHPLQYFIDNYLNSDNPTLAYNINNIHAYLEGKILVDGQAGTREELKRSVRLSFLRNGSDFPAVEWDTVGQLVRDDGSFSIDAALLLRTTFGDEVRLSDYKARLTMGNGIDFLPETVESNPKPFEDVSRDYDLGTINLVRAGSASSLVDVSGRVKSAVSGNALAGAEVVLRRGVNLSAEEVRAWPSSKVARKVITGSDGSFNVTGLSSGDYTVLITKNGYGEKLLGTVKVDGTSVVEFALDLMPSFVWDVVSDFQFSAAANAPWRYMFDEPNAGARLMGSTIANCSDLRMTCWKIGPAAIDLPFVAINNSGATISTRTIVVPTSMLVLHPGFVPPSGTAQRPIVSWTAPEAGTYAFNGRFEIVDTIPTGVRVIVKQDDQTLMDSRLNGFGSKLPISFTRVLAKGQAVSFTLDADSNHSNDSTGMVLTVTKQATQPEPAPSSVLFDDQFSGSVLNPTYWTSFGTPSISVSGGFSSFGCGSYATSKGKVEVSGDKKIVVEARFAGASWPRTTALILADSQNDASNLIVAGDTSYSAPNAPRPGMFINGSGAFATPIQDANGNSVAAYKEYRLTVIDKTVKIERGDNLNSITESISVSIPNSIIGKKLYVGISSGSPPYCPSGFDWVRVYSY